MTGPSDEILAPLLRATVLLAVSALLVRGLIWRLRPSSPAIQRAGWFLVLLQGVVLFHLPIKLAWLESQPRLLPGTVAENGSGMALDTPPAAPLPPPRPLISPPVAGAPAADPNRAPALLQSANGFSWASWAVTLWLAGVVCLPALTLMAYIRFLWRLSSARPA